LTVEFSDDVIDEIKDKNKDSEVYDSDEEI
jgi:hypothetical protein